MDNFTSYQYQALNKLLKKRVKEGLVVKTRKKEMMLGGPKYDYSLSEKGVEYLKRIAGLINQELRELDKPADMPILEGRTEEEFKDMVVDLYQDLPEMILDLDIEMTPAQYNELKNKLQKFFKKYEITI